LIIQLYNESRQRKQIANDLQKFAIGMPAFDIGLSFLTEKNALRYGPVTTKLSTYALHKVPVISAGISLKGYPKELSQGLF
jgi:hypothetical protein